MNNADRKALTLVTTSRSFAPIGYQPSTNEAREALKAEAATCRPGSAAVFARWGSKSGEKAFGYRRSESGAVHEVYNLA